MQVMGNAVAKGAEPLYNFLDAQYFGQIVREWWLLLHMSSSNPTPRDVYSLLERRLSISM